jgi:hypothetical protein
LRLDLQLAATIRPSSRSDLNTPSSAQVFCSPSLNSNRAPLQRNGKTKKSEMVDTKRLAPKTGVSRARPMAVTPFAQSRGIVHNQFPAAPTNQQNGSNDLDINNGNVKPSLGNAFPPTESFHFGQPTLASSFDLFGEHVGSLTHHSGGQSTQSYLNNWLSDYQSSTQEGHRYRQGGRQVHEVRGHDTQPFHSGTGANVDQQDYM